jgi:hypothetical protein
MQSSGAGYLFEVDFDPVDTILDHAPIEFDLSFAGAAKEAASSTLTFQVGPTADEARFLIG